MPYRSLRWPRGTAPNWQNHRFPDDAAFVVELPGGPLPLGAVERHVNAILGLRRALVRSTSESVPVRGEGAVARRPPRVDWHRSSTLGTPSAGRLERGVVLPSWGSDHVTWDPVLRRSPGRVWRRVGSDRLVRLVLTVAAAFRREHPDAPRLLVGDLSRPRGGPFGGRIPAGWATRAAPERAGRRRLLPAAGTAPSRRARGVTAEVDRRAGAGARGPVRRRRSRARAS